MSVVSHTSSLRHPPEAIISFVRRLIDANRTNSDPERRSDPRQAIEIPVVVQPLDERLQPAGNSFSAVTKDLSTGGVGLTLREEVTAKYLQVEIATPNGEEMSLLVQVRHCTPSGPLYHVGARFVADWSSWRKSRPSRLGESAAGTPRLFLPNTAERTGLGNGRTAD